MTLVRLISHKLCISYLRRTTSDTQRTVRLPPAARRLLAQNGVILMDDVERPDEKPP